MQAAAKAKPNRDAPNSEVSWTFPLQCEDVIFDFQAAAVIFVVGRSPLVSCGVAAAGYHLLGPPKM